LCLTPLSTIFELCQYVKTLILVLNILIVEGKIYMALDTRKLYYVHLLVIVLILEGQEYRYIDSPSVARGLRYFSTILEI
jgi:hypothetical protein